MMKKRTGKNQGYILGFLVIVAMISGAISFGIIYSRHRAEIKMSEQIKEEPAEEASAGSRIYRMEELLNGIEEVFLESFFGPNDIIELNNSDSDRIVRLLKELDLKFVKIADEEDMEYLYAVHIKNKNAKIKVNENDVYIENLQGEIQLFELDQKQLEHLKTELEALYMAKYNNHDIFQNPKDIQIAALDEGLEWLLDMEQSKALQDQIHLISPIGSDEVMGIPRSYPDFRIKVNLEEKDYLIHLMNKDVLLIDSSDNVSYYRYDSKLWNYVEKEYKINNSTNPSDLKYLIRAQKVVVDAVDNSFDMEDDTFYHIEIPRYIVKADKVRLEEPEADEELMFTMYFTINKQLKEVKIYDNQIIYGEQIYYSAKIGEAIKSFLNV